MAPLQVEVVSADALVWSGEADNVVAKTVDGDIGILVDHEPVLAVLVPGGVEIVCTNGEREIVAVDGGFMSVARNRVSVLSEYARMAEEISLSRAQAELQEATVLIEQGDRDEEVMKRFARASAQVKAAQKSQ